MGAVQILATIGPSSCDPETVRALARRGVTLFRINLSHTPLSDVEQAIRAIQEHTEVPISLDSEGAQIRSGRMNGGEALFESGALVRVHFADVTGDASNISLTPAHAARHLEVGDRVRLDFHAARIRVTVKEADHLIAVVEDGGIVGSCKAVDFDRDVPLGAITQKDRDAIEIGRRMGLTHFALSFANSEDDVREMRELIGDGAHLISKVESRRGLLALNRILSASDAILIDRGDLSRQIPIERIPLLQRRIIASARYQKTPVYVATNLLESMTTSAAPNRAEVNDVLSTLLMGADGLVLAAETAIGKYPIQAVEMVSKLIDQFERWTPDTSISDLLEF